MEPISPADGTGDADDATRRSHRAPGRRRAPARRAETRSRRAAPIRSGARAAAPTQTSAPAVAVAPTRPTGPSQTAAQTSFDDFYLATRRRVLLQCLALVGDLDVARTSVRDAYVSAYHHWRKVGAMDDPESWVRPQAWNRAQRRAKAKLRHSTIDLEPRQTTVLDGLARLSTPQRRALLLADLAGSTPDAIGREMAIPRPQAEEHLRAARHQLAADLGCEQAEVRPLLVSLAPIVTSPGLPRVTTIRRSGVRRRRWHLAGGIAVAAALTIGSGWFVSTHSPALGGAARRALEHPVTEAMLLQPGQLATVAPTGWHTTSTSRNTTGTGLHTPCQASRFADDRGLAAWVRTFSGPGGRSAVQTVEVSSSPGATAATYHTTVRWYAGCTRARMHLADSYRVRGLGDQAVTLDLRGAPGGPRYLVNIARSGEATQTTVVRTAHARDKAAGVTGVAADGLHGLCRSGAVSRCDTGRAISTRALVDAGGPRGMLATIDLPLLSKVRHAWVGTDAAPSTTNLASTPCDATSFAGKGRSPMTRSFLIPNASLPTQFGITETYASFSGARPAKAFVRKIAGRMATCEHRNLGSDVSRSFKGSGYAGWRVTSEINAKRTKVAYWMGVVRVGGFVAQVGFTPAAKADLTRAEFTALVVRARDRLATLANGPT